MKNKNGWGLIEMLVLVGVLALFLGIAIYYIYTFYNTIQKDVNKNDYYKLEERFEEQALIYIENYYDGSIMSDGITIKMGDLAKYDLDIVLEDKRGKACSGYVKASKSHAKIEVKAYIKCDEYITDGY